MVSVSTCGDLGCRFSATSLVGACAGLNHVAFALDAGAANAVAPALEMGVEGFHSVRSLSMLPERAGLFHSRPSNGKWRNNFGLSLEASDGEAVSPANNSDRLEFGGNGAAAGDASASTLGRRHHASRESGRSSVPKALTASGEAKLPFC